MTPGIVNHVSLLFFSALRESQVHLPQSLERAPIKALKVITCVSISSESK